MLIWTNRKIDVVFLSNEVTTWKTENIFSNGLKMQAINKYDVDWKYKIKAGVLRDIWKLYNQMLYIQMFKLFHIETF